jgi:hypothetical protein
MKNAFLKISLDKFVAKTIKSNPNMDAIELKKSLELFKKLKRQGELCDCGNPLWIIGSAISGKGCFKCITGETDSSNDYEIE